MDIVERLRDPESMYDADDVDLHLDAVDEIERLRKALQQIATIDYRGPMPDGIAIARKTLGGK